MTVNELLRQLEELKREGYGGLDIAIYEDSIDNWITDIEATYFRPSTKTFGYLKDGVQLDLPHVLIAPID